MSENVSFSELFEVLINYPLKQGIFISKDVKRGMFSPVRFVYPQFDTQKWCAFKPREHSVMVAEAHAFQWNV